MTVAESESRAASHGESVGVPWRSWPLVALLAATLMTPMDVPLVSPALTQVQAHFGVSESRAGLLLSAYAAPGIVLAPVIGALADRFGRRYVLAACLTVFGLAGTAVGFTNDFTVALALRVLQGSTAGAVFASLAMTVVGDRNQGRRHPSVMGLVAATLSIATAVYPAVGGYLASISWNAPFYLYGVCVVVAGVVLVALGDAEPTVERASDGYLRDAIRTVPTWKALRLYGIMFLAYLVLFGVLYTALPFHLADAFGYTPTQIGLLILPAVTISRYSALQGADILGGLTAGSMTSSALVVTAVVSTGNGRLRARFDLRELLLGGFALFTLALLGLRFATGVVGLAGSLVAFGAGSGLVTPTLFGSLSALAPDRVRAGVMSLQTTTIGASQAVGPALFTLLGARTGYEPAILGAGGGTAVVAIAVATFLPVDG